MSTPAGYALALILFFGRGRARGRATAKPTDSRRRNDNGKNPDGQGFKSGDFFAVSAKKYDSALDGLDRRNGSKKPLFLAGECGIIFPDSERQIIVWRIEA